MDFIAKSGQTQPFSPRHLGEQAEAMSFNTERLAD